MPRIVIRMGGTPMRDRGPWPTWRDTPSSISFDWTCPQCRNVNASHIPYMSGLGLGMGAYGYNYPDILDCSNPHCLVRWYLTVATTVGGPGGEYDTNASSVRVAPTPIVPEPAALETVMKAKMRRKPTVKKKSLPAKTKQAITRMSLILDEDL